MHTTVPLLMIMNNIDLNYRMDIPDHEMRKILGDDDWGDGLKFETLLRFDQVTFRVSIRTTLTPRPA